MSQPGDPSRPRTGRARRRVVRGWRLVSQTGARVVPLNRLNPRVRAKVMLPSLFTLGNMLCGFSSVLMAFQGRFRIAAVLIAASIVLDISDGAVARAVGAITPFGLQFDSLADLISFGIAPAVLVYTWALPSYPQWAWAGAMFWLACAAYRLARFNVTIDPLADKRYFIGLPSPGAAGVVIATVFAIDEPLQGPLLPIAAGVVPAALMATSFRFRSFRALVSTRHLPLTLGVGMTRRQSLTMVELPLALPVIMAGIRTAAVVNVGTATLAALIGAGGLGDPIVAGLALSDTRMILSSAIPSALLALTVDGVLGRVQWAVTPRALRDQRRRAPGRPAASP